MKKGFYLTVNVNVLFGLFCSVVLFAVMVLGIKAGNDVAVFQPYNYPLVVIDAGHGGEDGGTQSETGVLEKDINLAISLKLEKILKRYGFNTLMVRTEDKMIYDETATTVKSKKTSDLHNRMKIMQENENCIFVSIHQNHFTQEKYSGAQVFHRPDDNESSILAESIQKSIVNSLQKDNTRKIKPCDSNVYLINQAVSTAVMVECGFMSNKNEAEKLTDNFYQYEMALAIAKGIVDYLR